MKVVGGGIDGMTPEERVEFDTQAAVACYKAGSYLDAFEAASLATLIATYSDQLGRLKAATSIRTAAEAKIREMMGATA